MKPYKQFSKLIYFMSGPENVKLEDNIDKGNEKKTPQKNIGTAEQAKQKANAMIQNADKGLISLSDRADKETIKEITDNSFTTEVLKSPRPVLVAFSTSRNNNVKNMLSELKQEYRSFKFGNFDIDKNNKITSKFNINSDPTFILFHRGEVIQKIIGNGSEKIKQALSSMLK